MKADTVRLVERRIIAEPVFTCSRCQIVFGQRLSFCPVDGALVVGRDIDPLLGTLVGGRYRILKRIGKDALGRVYEVQHSLIERRFAMKIMCGELTTNQRAQREFVERAKALGPVAHPNLASVHDCGVTPNGQPYMVLDLAVGPSLRTMLDRHGSFDTREVRHILTQLVSSIQHMEIRNLPLPRISLESVLMTNPAQAQVKVLRCESRGTRDPDGALYAAGRVAYQLLHGANTGDFLEQRAPKIAEHHEASDPTLAATIRWMLSPSLNERPTSAEAVAASLKRREPLRAKRRRRTTWRRLLAMATPSLLPRTAGGPAHRPG